MNGRDDGAYLYARRMYEVMAAWRNLSTRNQPSFIADFANIWRAAEKVRCNPFLAGCDRDS